MSEGRVKTKTKGCFVYNQSLLVARGNWRQQIVVKALVDGLIPIYIFRLQHLLQLLIAVPSFHAHFAYRRNWLSPACLPHYS